MLPKMMDIEPKLADTVEITKELLMVLPWIPVGIGLPKEDVIVQIVVLVTLDDGEQAKTIRFGYVENKTWYDVSNVSRSGKIKELDINCKVVCWTHATPLNIGVPTTRN